MVKLQSGDEHCTAGWKLLCNLSRQEFQRLYDRMDIKLEEVGESFYNPMLKPLVAELIEKKQAEESEGAIVIKVGKKGTPPVMLQKSDGGFGYDSTDMACIRYRAKIADHLIYITDVSQELHFKGIFEAGLKCGFYDPKKTKVNHMMFGMVLGETEEVDPKTGKMVKKQARMKTRSGDTVKLEALLDEGRDRALKNFEDRKAAAAEDDANPMAKEVQIKD